jgi:hypothetical protein
MNSAYYYLAFPTRRVDFMVYVIHINHYCYSYLACQCTSSMEFGTQNFHSHITYVKVLCRACPIFEFSSISHCQAYLFYFEGMLEALPYELKYLCFPY